VLELRAALARSRIAFDPKPFAAHVTLLRDARKPRAMPALEPIRWEVEGLPCCGRSRRRGDYEILSSWKAVA